MILEGIKLTALGMMVVFSFLVFLVLVMKATASILRQNTKDEQALLAAKKAAKTPARPPEPPKKDPVPVIAAAISAHRSQGQG